MSSGEPLQPEVVATQANPYASPAAEMAVPVSEPAAEDGLTPELFAELQAVANHRHVVKTLKGIGGGSIAFGALALALGIALVSQNSLNFILVGIGALLLSQGIWVLINPTPVGLLSNGVLLIALGVWNLFVMAYNSAHGAPSTAVPIIPILQIIWGFNAFKKYQTFISLPRIKPSPAGLKRMDEIVKQIVKAKIPNDPSMIQFDVSAFMGRQSWRGRLRPNFATFVEKRGVDLIFARPQDISIRQDGKVMLGKSLKVSVDIGGRKFKGTMPPQSLDRYLNWKATEGGQLPPVGGTMSISRVPHEGPPA